MFDLPPPNPAIEFSVASRGMSKGVAQTDGPQLVVKPSLGLGSVQLGAAHKFQTAVREPTDDHSWEFTGSVTRKLGRLSLRVQAIYSPNDLGGSKRSIYIEGGPTFDLDKSTKLMANIGRRSRVDGNDYTSFNAGISRAIFKGFAAEARWYGTNRGALGETYDDQAVILARWAL